ncbi:MAG TPA: thioesterase family protein [Thermoanaerobaculia bacterium]|nr:thioesterase family protein [Thermoanaerobaculia bacterium]
MSETGWRHVEPIAVRWGDMDTMGHVNNAKYFTYCESARMSYFAAVRMPEHREIPTQGPALAAANLNFRRQVRYPADLDVFTRVVEIGRSSFKMEYLLVQRDTGERVADGHGVVVWVDYATGMSNPLPESLRRAIREYEGTPG